MRPVEITIQYLDNEGSVTITDDRGGKGNIIVVMSVKCDYDEFPDLCNDVKTAAEMIT